MAIKGKYNPCPIIALSSTNNCDVVSSSNLHDVHLPQNPQLLNENLETPDLTPALFSHLPGFYLKTGILNPSPFNSIL